MVKVTFSLEDGDAGVRGHVSETYPAGNGDRAFTAIALLDMGISCDVEAWGGNLL